MRTAPGVWVSYDPSPSLDGGFGFTRQTGFLHRLRQAYEAVEYYWVVYVVSFDEQMKRSLLARLGLEDANAPRDSVWEGRGRSDPLLLVRRVLRALGAGLIVFAATAAALFALVTLWRVLGGRLRLPLAFFRFPLAGVGRKRYGLAALERRYAAAQAALSRCDLERPRWQGAIDHARPSGRRSSARGLDGGLSAMYYETKFGGRDVVDDDLGRADTLVHEVRDRVRAVLRQRGSA